MWLWISYRQQRHLDKLRAQRNELLSRRAYTSRSLEWALQRGVDIRTINTWAHYQAIIDELWIVDNKIKAVRSCLMK